MPSVARDWLAALTITPLDTSPCTHDHATPAYRPPQRLQHLARIRHATCTAPGCRKRADACDLDHCIPYDKGGPTCLCNIHPACRTSHRAKQAPGWALTQNPDATMTWKTPTGRTYTTTPTEYPTA